MLSNCSTLRPPAEAADAPRSEAGERSSSRTGRARRANPAWLRKLPAKGVEAMASRVQITSCGPMIAASRPPTMTQAIRSEEHTSELQSRGHLVCRLLLEKQHQ